MALRVQGGGGWGLRRIRTLCKGGEGGCGGQLVGGGSAGRCKAVLGRAPHAPHVLRGAGGRTETPSA